MNRMVPDTLYGTADCGQRAVGRLVWLGLAVAIACSPPPALGGGDSSGPVIRATLASDHRPVAADLILPGNSGGRKASCDGNG